MSKSLIRSVKGTHDILPDQSGYWQQLETLLHRFFARYGYREIRTPVFERTELFARGVGADTDIVSKEMYTFLDRGKTSLTLKPEVTASVIRAYLEHSLGVASPLVKLYYIDRAFRQERPQAGRFRQHHQFGIEAIGSPHPEMDAEVISIAHDILQTAGLDQLTLKINSIGSPSCRKEYRAALRDFLRPYLPDLSATSQQRFETNPLRILDTKNADEIAIITEAPAITDYLTADDSQHFESVQSLLKELEIPFQLDTRLVRGLDYYTCTTFEITSGTLGAQNALCGGGRYDNLVETLGGRPTPAVGFAAGFERILMALAAIGTKSVSPSNQIYLICLESAARPAIMQIGSVLRKKGLRVESDMLRRSLKAQLREANRLDSKIAVIIGEQEFKDQSAQVKDFSTGQQETVSQDKLVKYLCNLNF